MRTFRGVSCLGAGHLARIVVHTRSGAHASRPVPTASSFETRTCLARTMPNSRLIVSESLRTSTALCRNREISSFPRIQFRRRKGKETTETGLFLPNKRKRKKKRDRKRNRWQPGREGAGGRKPRLMRASERPHELTLVSKSPNVAATILECCLLQSSSG